MRPMGPTDERNQPMIPNAEIRRWLANDRIAREHLYAAEARLADEARRRHRLSLRHRTARQLIRLGERLAAEPTLRPARSRQGPAGPPSKGSSNVARHA